MSIGLELSYKIGFSWGKRGEVTKFMDAMLSRDWNGFLPLEGNDLAWIEQYVSETDMKNLEAYGGMLETSNQEDGGRSCIIA